MRHRRFCFGLGLLACLIALAAFPASVTHAKNHDQSKPKPKRNVIIFIADGLRHGSVNPTDSPTLWQLRLRGVHFMNSHSIFPTFTTANASVMATGHLLGDTGDFSNTIAPGFAIFDTGNFGRPIGTVTPFIENNQVLGDLDDHFSGNYLNEATLLSTARQNGYSTASVGKVGPAGIWDASQLDPYQGNFATPTTVIVDDATGTAAGVPLPTAIQNALTDAGLPTTSPTRSNGAGATDQNNNGYSGTNQSPGTLKPNLVQQQYFADALTKAILPTFVGNGEPFVAIFWSRDPDGTQHNQGDSLNSLTPGINGPTSKASIKNVDNNLAQILAYIESDPSLAANTDIFVTADHGFSTISHHEADASGRVFIGDYASGFTYKDTTGRQEVNTGFTPVGFVAIDLAHQFNLPLYDPDSQIAGAGGVNVYEPVDPTIGQQTATVRQHPASGDGVIGGTGKIPPAGTPTDAKILVAANGGSDLIYVPDHDVSRVRDIVKFLLTQRYTGGIFVDDDFGDIPGTLPLSTIGLKGSTLLPTPAIALNFRNFSTDWRNPEMTRVEIADSGLQEGQGMHGSFSRADTYNNMAAIGPDFKSRFTDWAPISNADITPTIAHILGFDLASTGDLQGRVLKEALVGGPDHVEFRYKVDASYESNNRRTVLQYQKAGGLFYFDAACLVDGSRRLDNDDNPCR